MVSLPYENKAIGYKWVFRKKMNSYGNIDKCKARWLGKGFTQKKGLDYLILIRLLLV